MSSGSRLPGVARLAGERGAGNVSRCGSDRRRDLSPLRPRRPTAGCGQRLFEPATPVAGFVFKDMSRVNLRSFPVRNVLGSCAALRGLAVQARRDAPDAAALARGDPVAQRDADRTRHPHHRVRLRRPCNRFAAAGLRALLRRPKGVERRLRDVVFRSAGRVSRPCPARGDRSGRRAGLRALPPDWNARRAERVRRHGADGQFPSGRRIHAVPGRPVLPAQPPTAAQRAMTRPDLQDLPPPLKAPDTTSTASSPPTRSPEPAAQLGLVIDCVLRRIADGRAARRCRPARRRHGCSSCVGQTRTRRGRRPARAPPGAPATRTLHCCANAAPTTTTDCCAWAAAPTTLYPVERFKSRALRRLPARPGRRGAEDHGLPAHRAEPGGSAA